MYSSRPNFILQISFLQLLDQDLFAFLWYIQRNSRASGRMHAYYHHSRGGKPASGENCWNISSKGNCEFSFLEFANFLYRCWDSLLTKLSLTKMSFLLLTKLSLTKLLLTKMLHTKLLPTKFTLPNIRPSFFRLAYVFYFWNLVYLNSRTTFEPKDHMNDLKTHKYYILCISTWAPKIALV